MAMAGDGPIQEAPAECGQGEPADRAATQAGGDQERAADPRCPPLGLADVDRADRTGHLTILTRGPVLE